VTLAHRRHRDHSKGTLNFLLTNDDGIHAPGIAALARAVSLLPGASCSIVAPEDERSMCGHRLTTHAPFHTTAITADRHAVDGTPADCVRVALYALKLKPDFVLSGVNAGGNMGQDIHVSGTCAAAREAAYHGLPAMAVSHYLLAKLEVDWERASRWVAEVIGELMQGSLAGGEYWNVNLPHLPPGELALPPRVIVNPCRAPLPVSFESTEVSPGRFRHHYNARYADRLADTGSDVEICFGGRIAVARLQI
jgi:5'-nucleotidase